MSPNYRNELVSPSCVHPRLQVVSMSPISQVIQSHLVEAPSMLTPRAFAQTKMKYFLRNDSMTFWLKGNPIFPFIKLLHSEDTCMRMDLKEGVAGFGSVGQELARPRREPQAAEPSSLQVAACSLLTFAGCSGAERGPDSPLVVLVLR